MKLPFLLSLELVSEIFLNALISVYVRTLFCPEFRDSVLFSLRWLNFECPFGCFGGVSCINFLFNKSWFLDKNMVKYKILILVVKRQFFLSQIRVEFRKVLDKHHIKKSLNQCLAWAVTFLIRRFLELIFPFFNLMKETYVFRFGNFKLIFAFFILLYNYLLFHVIIIV